MWRDDSFLSPTPLSEFFYKTVTLSCPLGPGRSETVRFYVAQFSVHLCPPFPSEPQQRKWGDIGAVGWTQGSVGWTEQRTKSVEKPVVSQPSERQRPLLEKDPIVSKVGNMN